MYARNVVRAGCTQLHLSFYIGRPQYMQASTHTACHALEQVRHIPHRRHAPKPCVYD